MSTERQPLRRRRPALSCIQCRRRKIKCDRNDPCAHCVSASSQCIYRIHRSEQSIHDQSQQGDPRYFPLAPPGQAATPVAQARGTGASATVNENIPCEIEGQTATGVPQHLIPRISDGSEVQQLIRVPDVEPALQDLLQRVRKLEQNSAANHVHEPVNLKYGLVAHEPGAQTSQTTLNKTRLFRWSHRMGSSEFDIIRACYMEAFGNGDGDSFQGAEKRDLIGQIGNLLHNCKTLARSIKVAQPGRPLSSCTFDFTLPSRELADKMAHHYFRSFESVHRILHVPTFWTEYEGFWSSLTAAPIDLRLKILLVVAIGSFFHEQGTSDHGFRQMVHQWVLASEMWLSGPLTKDRLEITGIQIYCLTILARQIFSIGGDLLWMSTGSLIYRAMQMGLHRDPNLLPAMSVLQAELRRRLWYTILEMVIQSSLDSAMPPRISFSEFDTQPPANLNDDEIDESTMTLQPQPKDIWTGTSMQLLLVDSQSTRLRIVQLLNNLISEISYSDALALSSEVTDACRRCYRIFRDHEHSGITAFHRNLIDYYIRRFLLPLHCKFANQARANPLYYYSLKISIDTSLTMIIPEPDESFSHLITAGGAMFKEGFRSACATVSNELLAEVTAQRLDGTLHRNSPYRELLREAVKKMLDLSLERIQQGETNVKGHMFQSMVLAQAKAKEADLDCEIEVARSARDSLFFCRDLLQKRVESITLPDYHNMELPWTSRDDWREDDELDFDFDIFLPDANLRVT